MSIGVTAATGHLGKLILEYLPSKGHSVVAFARKPEGITASGVDKRALDYVTASAADFAGISTLVLISSGSFDPPRIEQHKKVIDAAKAAGVKHILYTSIIRSETSALVLAGDHKATEEYLKASGVPYTALRNGWYLENWFGNIDGVLNGGILGATHGAKLSPATRRDFAEAAANLAARVQKGEPIKTHWELGGVAITLDELAAEVSVRSGKTVKYIDFTQDDLAKTLEGFGLPSPIAFVFAQADEAASAGGLYTETTDLVDALGHAPENWREAVGKILAK